MSRSFCASVLFRVAKQKIDICEKGSWKVSEIILFADSLYRWEFACDPKS